MDDNRKTAYEKLRRKYFMVKIMLFVSLSLLGAALYQGYNYWVFKALIAGNYIYTDTLDELYAESIGAESIDAFRADGYAKHFDDMVIAVVTGAIRAKNDDRYTHLYTPEAYSESKAYEKSDAALADMQALSGNTVLINLPNFSKGTRQFLFAHKNELGAYENIIIDLRHNYGGMLTDHHAMSELFLPKGTVIGYENTRSPVFSRKIMSKKAQSFSFDRIVILQNENTASAAEAFIMALKENLDSVTLVGTQTFGKGVGQVTLPLTGGYAVKGTVLSLLTPSKKSIHGVGIPPDVPYDEEDAVQFGLRFIESLAKP